MAHDEGTDAASPTPLWLPQDLPTPPDEPTGPDPFAIAAPQPSHTTTGTLPPTAYPTPTGYPMPTGYPAPPPGLGPYGAQRYYTSPPPPGIPALVIIGFVSVFVVPLVGLVVSIVALVRVRRSGSPGRGLAIAGVAIGSLPVVAAIAIPIYMSEVRKAEAGPRAAFSEVWTALATGDCEGFQAGTTANFQYQLGLTDCAQFDAYVANVSAMGGFGMVPIVDVAVDGDIATVTTFERIGEGAGEPVIVNVDYTVVRMDGSWRVTSLAFAD